MASPGESGSWPHLALLKYDLESRCGRGRPPCMPVGLICPSRGDTRGFGNFNFTLREDKLNVFGSRKVCT
eukprot:4387692-Amphidinium_carterae.1